MIKKILIIAGFICAMVALPVFGLEDSIQPEELNIFYRQFEGEFDSISNTQILYAMNESPEFIVAELLPYGYAISLRESGKICESAIQPDYYSPYQGILRK